MIPIEVLIRKISSDELFELFLDSLEAVEIPARSWRKGGVARSILGVLAQKGSQGAAVLADLIGGMYLLFAEGIYLTAHAEDVYGVERIEATFAAGEVVLTNTKGAVHTVGANECIVRSSNTGARYRVTEGFVLSSGSEAVPTSITVDVQAIEAGAGSTVAPAELDELETTLVGVSVMNEASIVGQDAESDEALRARCLAKRGTWSPFGPRDAYEYAALSATLPDGSPTGITRVSVSRYSSTGTVRVVCATPTGTPTTAALDAVRAEIERIARPDTVTVLLEGAVPQATAHSIIIWARGGTTALLLARAQKALATMISTYPIGGIPKTEGGTGYLYADRIAATVIGASPEIFDVDFVGGPVDVALGADQVATNTTTFEVRIL